jgi:superfamily I DNA and/or RNA helicase
VVFLDTDGLVPPAGVARTHQHKQCDGEEEGRAWLESGGGDGNAGGSLINAAEAGLVVLLVEGLRRCHFDVARGVGILSPYRSQVSALKTALLAAVAAAEAVRARGAAVETETETDADTERESEEEGAGSAMETEAVGSQALPEVSTVDKYQVN